MLIQNQIIPPPVEPPQLPPNSNQGDDTPDTPSNIVPPAEAEQGSDISSDQRPNVEDPGSDNYFIQYR